jgi:hypothetical protein
MEPTKRMAAGGDWDCLPKEIVSLITVKVAETSKAPLEDLRSLWLCNKATKRASSSRAITNHFNLEHHYQSMVWEGADALDAYLQTVDWLQGANNGGAPSSRGWATYARADPVVQHSSHERKRKETYKRPTC